MNKILVIGQAPSRSGDFSKPLEGRIGRKLAGLAGISFDQYLKATWRINLFLKWPGKRGKGDLWDDRAARAKASELLSMFSGRTVLLLGRNVAKAFGLEGLPWLTCCEIAGGKVAVLPHPSGIVRWWNSKENRKAAALFLFRLFEEA